MGYQTIEVKREAPLAWLTLDLEKRAPRYTDA